MNPTMRSLKMMLRTENYVADGNMMWHGSLELAELLTCTGGLFILSGTRKMRPLSFHRRLSRHVNHRQHSRHSLPASTVSALINSPSCSDLVPRVSSSSFSTATVSTSFPPLPTPPPYNSRLPLPFGVSGLVLSDICSLHSMGAPSFPWSSSLSIGVPYTEPSLGFATAAPGFSISSTLPRDPSLWLSIGSLLPLTHPVRAMDLQRTLSNLSKDPKQSMEDYLQSTKYIADSLASIWTPVPDIDLVQLTLNGLDEDYHNLVTMLSYGTNLIAFDDLRSKLIHYEQRLLKFLKSKLLGIQHQALATSLASSESGASGSPRYLIRSSHS
ncbi:hypothetical protein Cgig2_009463 [Carnegiea gigantea]|uniref:UBN2_3 domain-containing protein n=1 Tax=Carnegiea gigantea TaxID=171969 RepID=A0A9Q1K7F3_9CARY|nr:hypothetical protein Cgig2_009463 [Carnegiea gigantea]